MYLIGCQLYVIIKIEEVVNMDNKLDIITEKTKEEFNIDLMLEALVSDDVLMFGNVPDKTC